MTRNEAQRLASGYAWAREDCTHALTATTTSASGDWEFSNAYAQGWEDYDNELRGSVPPVRSAYERWQATGGTSIFADGETTAELQAKRAARKARNL